MSGDSEDDDERPISEMVKAKLASQSSSEVQVKKEAGGANGDNKAASAAVGGAGAAASAPAAAPASKPTAAASSSASSSSSSSSSSAAAAAAPPKIAKRPVEDASDSEDDMPIRDMIERRMTGSKAPAPAAKKQKTDSDKPKASSASSSSSSTSNARAIAGTPMSVDFYDTNKGFLAQKLLCRWWYAIEWPKKDQIGTPPPGFEPLDGFPGVFVSTRTDSLGVIKDLRDKSSCPCLKNFAKMSSAELQALCITAYERQMKALEAAEGPDVRLMQELKSELKEVKAVNVDKADKEGKKFLTAF